MIEILRDNPLLLLFVVAALGTLLGRIRIAGFSLGVAAVLFTGLAVGSLDPGLKLPEIVHLLGLVLFVYALGLAGGPGFIASFRRQGLRDNLFIAGMLVLAAGLSALAGRIFGLDAAMSAGLFAGSLTNTPALAALLETLGRGPGGEAALAEPVIAYSVAYPVGVVGMILAIYLLQRVFHTDYRAEAAALSDLGVGGENLEDVTVRVTNRAVSEIDIATFGLGIALGLLLGLLPIPVPGFGTFRLGLAGGPLLVGLALGILGRTGPFLWQMPYSVNLSLRQIGVVLFLAGIGTRSGWAFADTFRHGGGLIIFLCGVAITCLTAFLTLWIGHRLLKIPMSLLTGMLSGLQTQPAVLAYANEQAGHGLPDVGYATVYPVATIAKILLAQIIWRLLA